MRDLEQRADGRPQLFRDISPEDMQKWVSDYEAYNPEARQDLTALVNDIKAVQDLSVTSDAAFIAPEDLARARTKRDGSEYQFYTPVQRATPEEVARPSINAQNVGTLGRQKVLQEMTGSDIPLDPTFDALTDYTETVFKQLGQARVVQKVSERVKQGLIPGARFIQTGDESARIKTVQKTIVELRDVLKTMNTEKTKVRFRLGAANKDLKTSTKEVSNRVREQLRGVVDDPDAAAAIGKLSDGDLQDVMRLLTEPDIKKTPNVQRIYDRFVKKSEAHANIAQRLDDLKMDIESVNNAKKGLGRELVDLRPDSITGRQTILGIDANGNKFRIELPPEYASVLQGLDKEKMNDALRAMKTVQQPFREAFTGILNPSFQLAQATFNAMMAPVISKAGYKVYRPAAIKAAIQSFANHGEFQHLLNEKGAIKYGGNLDKLATDNIADALASQADTVSKLQWYANPKRAWSKLSRLGGKLDQAARTASAKAIEMQSIRAGRTAEEAAADAVYAYNNTLPNFSNLSSLIKGADALVMYTGAGQAGTRTFLRAIKEDPVRVGGKIAASGTVLTGVAAYNMSQDKGQEFYQDMNDSGKNYVLTNNIVVVLPGARKDPKTGEWTGIVKIPIAPEFRPINRAVQDTLDKNTSGVPLKTYALSMFDFVTGQARQSSNPALQLGYGIATGRDPRTGQDIYDETLTPEDKKKQIAKFTARSFGVPGQAITGGLDAGAKAQADNGNVLAQAVSGGLGAVKDSLVNKVIGAKGMSDGAKYYKLETDTIKRLGLNKNEADAFRSTVNPRNKDLAGNVIKDKTYYDGASKAITWLRYPKTFEVSQAIDAEQRAKGEPGDPLFDLPEDKKKVVLNMMANYSPGNKEEKAIKELNPWLEDFNKKRSDYFEQILDKPSTINVPGRGVDPKGITIPKADKTLQAKLDSLKTITDKAQRAAFYESNPEVTDFYKKVDDYQRVKRGFLGLPQFDRYPTPSPEVQKTMDAYNALPKGNGPPKKDGTASSPNRSAWIKAHPKEFATLTDQWTKQDIYKLQEEGSLAVYEGLDFTEDGIKSITDIAKALGVSGGGKGGYSSATSDYLGIAKLLGGIRTDIPEAPTITPASGKKLYRFQQPYSNSKKPQVKVKLN
jgi:hypothetical protein